MSKKIALLPGDGIGKEVIASAWQVVKKATTIELESREFDLGSERYLKTGEVFPEAEKEALKEFDAVYLGALGDPRVKPGVLERGILLALRFEFDQFANLRPLKLYRADLTPLKGVDHIDVMFFRENTEDLYVGAGGILKKGTADEVALQELIQTRKGVERIIRYAFEWAKNEGRKKVTLIDKSNVLTFAHDLWQRVFWEVAVEYPELKKDHLLVDAAAMKMVLAPESLDVVVTTNMFGDILTDLGAAICGGLGLAASGNINPTGLSMFEPVHGSAPDIAGKNIANPLATVLAGAMMLSHLGDARGANKLEEAVRWALQNNQVTPDLGGSLTTTGVGEALIAYLEGRV